MGAVGAARDMTAKRRCATALNRAHHLQLGQANVALVGIPPGSTMGADISATSSDGLDMAAYEGRTLSFLRLAPFRSSSGLSTAAIIPVATLA